MKGINPLVASVLLITFAVGVAPLIVSLGSQVVSEATGSTQTRAEDLADIRANELDVEDVRYDGGNISGTVHNTGSVRLQNYSVAVVGDDINRIVINQTLPPGDFAPFYVRRVSNASKVRVTDQTSGATEQVEIGSQDLTTRRVKRSVGLNIESVGFDRVTRRFSVNVENTGEVVDTVNGVSVKIVGDAGTSRDYDVDIEDGEVTSLELPIADTFDLQEVRITSRKHPIVATREVKCAPSAGLVGYWSMNEQQTEQNVAKDLSVYSNNGQITGGRLSGGVAGKAWRFNDSDTHGKIKIPDSSSLQVHDGNFTYFMWLNLRNITDSKHILTLGKWKEGGSYAQVNNGGVLSFIYDAKNVRSIVTKESVINKNEWNSLSFRRNSSVRDIFVNADERAIQYLLNGQYKVEQDETVKTNIWNGNKLIGSYPGRPEYVGSLYGRIDEVRIYNRSLSESEIQRLHRIRDKQWATEICKLAG